MTDPVTTTDSDPDHTETTTSETAASTRRKPRATTSRTRTTRAKTSRAKADASVEELGAEPSGEDPTAADAPAERGQAAEDAVAAPRTRRRSGGTGRRGAGRADATAEPGDEPVDTASTTELDRSSAAVDAEPATEDEVGDTAADPVDAPVDDTAARDTSAAADAAGDAADEDAEATSDDPSSDEGGTPRKRRRRGRRGRGGRGGQARAATDAAEDAGRPAGRDDDVPGPAEDRTSPPDEDDLVTGEEDVEAAIARGGTRKASKRLHDQGARDGGRRGAQRIGGVSEEVRRAILEGPPRTMLVTAKQDATQIAVLEDRTVVEHYVTRTQDVTYVGNVYMGRVQNVLAGMEAAFLDIGKGRNGVLYAGEVLFDELDLEEGADERIENVLKPGQKVLVQVTKDPMGAKGPRLTMRLSLAGRYMVLAPGAELFGISRKLTDRERDRLRRIVKQLDTHGHGVIVRTAAEGATEEQMAADLDRLLAKWAKVEEAAKDAKALTAVYEEPPLVVKVIRDNFGPEFERCIVDDEALYHQVRDYLDEVAPELLDRVELYGAARDAGADTAGAGTPGASASGRATADTAADADDARPPLFDAYDVTDQLRKAMARKVWLPSGGYLIIESTEAMKVIDVNTGKFTGDGDTNLEEVVLKTNLEAAEEIVRQLRLRDLGGIIVIDFIDMLLKANQDQVVRRLKRELLRDRTKTRVSEVSRLGLVQMTRKNVSQGLVESFSHVCEACEGRGLISELD